MFLCSRADACWQILKFSTNAVMLRRAWLRFTSQAPQSMWPTGRLQSPSAHWNFSGLCASYSHFPGADSRSHLFPDLGHRRPTMATGPNNTSAAPTVMSGAPTFQGAH